MLCQAAGPGMTFYNTSRFVFQPTEVAQGKKYVSLLSDQEQIAANLTNFIAGFSLPTPVKSSWTSSSLATRSTCSMKATSFTLSSASSPRSTSIPMSWTTSRWATSLRNSSWCFSEASNETAGEHLHTSEIVVEYRQSADNGNLRAKTIPVKQGIRCTESTRTYSNDSASRSLGPSPKAVLLGRSAQGIRSRRGSSGA